MYKYILVSTYAHGVKMDISHSVHGSIEAIESVLVKLGLDGDMISEILSGDTVCDDYESLCYWKLIEVNNVKT